MPTAISHLSKKHTECLYECGDRIMVFNNNPLTTVMAYCRYGRVCRLVKLRISMIRTFSFGNISHITLYAQLEIV